MQQLACVNTGLYGGAMSMTLSAADWISAGLRALAKDGFAAVKADLLAKKLGVSRGSFYWHFKDIDAFHKAVIRRWQEVATQAVIAELEARAKGAGRLHLLLDLAMRASVTAEASMRAWADFDRHARAAVASVDRRRLDYIERVLAEEGIAPPQAQARAGILYWTYLGFALSHQRARDDEIEQLIGELVRFATL